MTMPQPPRISFSGDFGQVGVVAKETNKAASDTYDPDFEFISTSEDSDVTMLPADELFFQGRLVPFWPSNHRSSTLEKVAGINVALNGADAMEGKKLDQYGHEIKERRYNTSTHGSMNCGSLSWLVDDDPSPRPPKCTVLWKELLKLKKQQSSEEAEKEGKRKKKGLERTRSASVRIRPFVKVPICTTTNTTNTHTHGKNIVLPR